MPVLFSMLLTIIILICSSFSIAPTCNEWIWCSFLWRTALTVGFFVSISIILRNEGQDLPTWGHLLLANLSFEFLVIEKSTYLILKDLDGENGVCVHGCIFFICLFMQLSPNPITHWTQIWFEEPLNFFLILLHGCAARETHGHSQSLATWCDASILILLILLHVLTRKNLSDGSCICSIFPFRLSCWPWNLTPLDASKFFLSPLKWAQWALYKNIVSSVLR